MKLSDFDYPLDRSLIAQRPPARRGTSRLMLLDRETGAFEHGRFQDFLNELDSDDLLVLNHTKVMPARVVGEKSGTGGCVELLFLHPVGASRWSVLAKGTLREGQEVRCSDGHGVTVVVDEGDGRWTVQSNGQGDVMRWLARIGRVPVPPYIRRTGTPAEAQLDRRRYQTVYAAVPGSVAAPTAGLHFSTAQLRELKRRRIPVARVTLHIGIGTFQPIRSDEITSHRMAAEHAEVDDSVVRAVAAARRRGGRVIAVGTSTVRALESAAVEDGLVAPLRGWTDLFITPGHRFRAVDALLTNFHLPKSSLLCLVGAFAGLERLLAAYRTAMRARYRFYSYGDAMFIRTGRTGGRA
ncbi:MAG TPA: tRNA preQ1(34) S-adenosylmethionine ribosyltransferase-isomerase QueA [Nitrospiria bacterium]|nr:tRNA preQ1(34) S-adenosylmethionine ribosyltransferase-isomerase QueA [Nitrospiria bacterium]